MKTSFVGLVLSSVALISLAGCSKPSPEEQKKKEEALAASLASAFASAMPKESTAPAKPINLEKKTVDKFGVTVSVPEGAKVISDDAFGISYSLVFEGGFDEISVSVAKAIGVNNMKSAVEDATFMGGKDLDVKTEVDKGTIHLEKAPVANTIFVYQYKKVKGSDWVKASCSGPLTYKAKVVEACSSLAPK